jgi:hypothetical protein
MIVIPPIIIDRIGIVARARRSGAILEGTPRQLEISGEEATQWQERNFGAYRWSKIKAFSDKKMAAVFLRSKKGRFFKMIGIGGKWSVVCYPDTPVDSEEAEALVLQFMSLFSPNVQVIDRLPTSSLS